MSYEILRGDCLEVLKTLPDNSFDGCLSDPPYALKFMGKSWDKALPSVEVWAEVLRVLKPGASLLSFGGSRTFHRLACNIEDGGFNLIDTLLWLHGQGFPKSLDISKAIDSTLGATREKLCPHPHPKGSPSEGWGHKSEAWITKPATPQAQQWEGYGTQLKPAYEPVVLATKPNQGTFASNALAWGVGGLNVDGCRIGDNAGWSYPNGRGGCGWGKKESLSKNLSESIEATQGRFPANLILDEEAASLLDSQAGNKGGGPSRFFYCAKASKAEREKGLEDLPPTIGANGNKWTDQDYRKGDTKPTTARRNIHPTVKPLALCKWLATLLLPPARETPRRLLVPYSGSGSEIISGLSVGFEEVTGIELCPEYIEIAHKRIYEFIS